MLKVINFKKAAVVFVNTKIYGIYLTFMSKYAAIKRLQVANLTKEWTSINYKNYSDFMKLHSQKLKSQILLKLTMKSNQVK